MLNRLIAPVIAGALVLTACETNETATIETATTDTAATGTASAADSIAPSASGGQTAGTPGLAPGELAPINRSGVRGRAQLERDDDEVVVTVDAEGLESGMTYTAQVHRGGCADGGAILLQAGRVTAGADGAGTLRFRGGSAAVLDEGEDGEVSVQIHGEDGQAVACATVDQD